MNEKIKRALLRAHNEKHSDDILKMRRAVQWAGSQDENFWVPVDKEANLWEEERPTIAQIVRAYELVGLDDSVFSIEDALEQFSAFDRKKYLELCSALNREPVGKDND